MSLNRYRAFGLNIDSEVPIAMLLPEEPLDAPDVRIVYGDLSGVECSENNMINESSRFFFRLPDSASFLIENGASITVDAKPDAQPGLLAVYLLGSCMGALLYQRGGYLLHGSCVSRDGKAILLTGDSGAGKSTLAAHFLSNGWKLVTDDVAAVRGIEEGNPLVYPSYPSQKLWQDAIERTDYQGELFSLFQEDRREKFNVRVQAFSREPAALTAVVRLIPTDDDCAVEPVTGFARVDQLMRNTYRLYMVPEADRERHFQRCVTLGNNLTMLVALRARSRDTTGDLYRMILEHL